MERSTSIGSLRGFTLIETIFVIALVAVLATLGITLGARAVAASEKATCTSNLRQLGSVVQAYLNDHDGFYFPYREKSAEGTMWYFGLETHGGGAEGERELDRSAGPLHQYVEETGGIEICPGFDYGDALYKPKFKGASWAYGYNWHLGGGWSGRHPMNVAQLSNRSQVIVFADCAQANNFQAPATADKPMLEEFYLINEEFKTIHFRHNHAANFLFADGHVEARKMLDGTRDERLKSEHLGRITPSGSLEFLK